MQLNIAAAGTGATAGVGDTTVADERPRNFVTLATDVVFVLLLVANVVRTLRHAMWRDELQVWLLGSNSRTLVDLFHNLKYEPHAALWHGLVWIVAHLTSNPAWMQVLHATLAVAVWIIVYRYSPFTRVEKFLLLLSYFLFWEYFIISRSYVLAALLGLGFVALRHHRPRQSFLPWLVLGLLANLVAHATIWSIAMAAIFALEERRCNRAFTAGAAAYLALLAFGIATMMPLPDASWAARASLNLTRLNDALAVPLGAFIPVNPDWSKAVLAFMAHPFGAPLPSFWNPSPHQYVITIILANVDHPLRLAALVIVPIAICGLVTRDPYRVLEFSLAYVGIMLFATIWIGGAARHHGVLFLALIASVWMARARSGRVRASWLLVGLLAINACAGALTLASEFVPFSQGRNAARWIEQSNLADTFLVGSRAQASTVAGYLARPVYYIECECMGTFIVYSVRRQPLLSTEQFRNRLARAFERNSRSDSLLISHRPIAPDEFGASASPISAVLLQSFVGAVTKENYWIYHVTTTHPDAQKK